MEQEMTDTVKVLVQPGKGLKNKDLFRLLSGLQSVADLKGVKFVYAAARNIRTISAVIEDLQKGIQYSEGMRKYDEERQKLCIKHSKKDGEGKPVMNGKSFDIGNMDRFNVAIEKLRTVHKKSVDEHDIAQDEYEKLLEENADIRIHKIAIEEVPDSISVMQLNSILEMIMESDTP